MFPAWRPAKLPLCFEALLRVNPAFVVQLSGRLSLLLSSSNPGFASKFTAASPDRPEGRPLTDAEAAYALRQAGVFGTQVRWLAQQHAVGHVLRPHRPRGGGAI